MAVRFGGRRGNLSPESFRAVTAIRAPKWTLIWVIAFALAADYLVYGIVLPLTPFSPAGISKDEELTILTGCYGVGTLLTTPVFGYLGDRFGCRRLVVYGALLLGVATAVLAFAPSFSVMVLGRLLQGVAAASTWTGGLALVAKVYSRDRVQMMGYALMGSTGGSVAGPALAGTLHAVGGYRLPFYVVLAIIALVFAACALLLPPDKGVAKPDANVLTLLADRNVLVPAFAIMLAASAWTIVESLVPTHLARGGANSVQIGAMFTLTTLVYGLSAPLATWFVGRFGMRGTAVSGAASMALTIPLVAVSTNIFIVGAAAALVNITYALLLNPKSAELGDVVESRGLHCYCAVYSVYNVAYSIGTICTSVLASALLPHFSLQIVLLCISGALVLTIPLLARRTQPLAPVPSSAA
jgi:DHA1 family solute carrier family 18 vesicular amine transporter 1/2